MVPTVLGSGIVLVQTPPELVNRREQALEVTRLSCESRPSAGGTGRASWRLGILDGRDLLRRAGAGRVSADSRSDWIAIVPCNLDSRAACATGTLAASHALKNCTPRQTHAASADRP